MKRLWLLLMLAISATPAAYAHLGSKDVFEQVSVGPYNLFITIRTPNVIPGVATVEVRVTGAGITTLNITPIPLVGEASKHPPVADTLKQSAIDPNFYTGGVWIMASGSWQVRFEIDGSGGRQVTSVPVPAIALTTLKMQRDLGIPLALLGVFLVVSMAGVVAAAIREARLQPGVRPTPKLRRRGLIAMTASLIVMALMVYGGAKWWNVEAASYASDVYRPMTLLPELRGDELELRVKAVEIGNGNNRHSFSNTDFLSDHGHLMHLYAIREPQMDAIFHLHPELTKEGGFRMSLPAMPPGSYTLYGDVVHANGFPETLVANIDIPSGKAAAAPGPDDASANPSPLSAGPLGPSYKLPDGYTMVWDRPTSLTASTAYSLHFRLLAPDGTPARDMQPYMGMPGHAAFIKDDRTVFAHTHPEGSAAMAALEIANGTMGTMTMGPTPSEVGFPYGFPTPGPYRIIIQMKHGDTIETGVFDATVQ